jgi:hypothetical protein
LPPLVVVAFPPEGPAGVWVAAWLLVWVVAVAAACGAVVGAVVGVGGGVGVAGDMSHADNKIAKTIVTINTRDLRTYILLVY